MRIADTETLGAALSASARKSQSPLRVMVELTYDCNFRCSHCYVPRSHVEEYRQRELSTRRVFALLKALREMGCFYLGFTGGEPLMHPDFLAIVRRAQELGFAVMVNTNGSLITAKMADSLGRLALNKVDITIPAISKSAFGKVTGRPDLHARFFQGIRLLKSRGVRLGFKTCILPSSRKELPRIRAFARSCHAQLRISDEILPQFGARISRPSRRPGPSCGAGLTQAAITPAGELKFCVAVDSPKWKIRDAKSLQRLWKKLGQAASPHHMARLCPERE